MSRIADLQEQFNDMEEVANLHVIERKEEVHTGVLALLSANHHFSLGPPGNAKSMLCNLFVSLIEGTGFASYSNLLTRQTKQEEVFGSISFKGLEEDRVRFNVEGFLPAAHVAFLDEIFKGSGATLNPLLTILNERTFRNDGATLEVPLITGFCASNEIPKRGGDLDALYDRLPIKHITGYIEHDANFIRMLKAPKPNVDPILDLDSLHEAIGLVKDIEIDDDVYPALVALRNKFNGESVIVSDRKWRQAMSIIKAQAWLRGDTVAHVGDLRPLVHVLWAVPDTDFPIVEKAVMDISNPVAESALELRNDVDALIVEIDDALRELGAKNMNESVRVRTGVKFTTRLMKATDEMNNLKKEADEYGAEEPMLDTIKVRLIENAERVQRKILLMTSTPTPEVPDDEDPAA